MTVPDRSRQNLRVYTAFGRTIVSDCAIPFPAASEETSGDRIEIVENRGACAAEPPVEAQLLHEVEDFRAGPRLRVLRDGEFVWIDYVGYRFRMLPRERTIEYCEVQSDEAGVGFDGLIERVVLPIFLLFEAPDVVGVHGGSVSLGGRAWAFIGDSGAGKSTTARVLVEEGAKLVADDLTLVDVAEQSVLPGCPAVRLWEEEGAVPLAVEDRPESSLRTKRWFRFPDVCTASEPTPLGGIFVLDAQPADAEIAEPTFTKVGGQEAFALLMAQTFDISNPEPEWSRRRFAAVATLARSVPIYRYTYARSASGEPTHVGPLAEFIASRSSERTP